MVARLGITNKHKISGSFSSMILLHDMIEIAVVAVVTV